MHEVEHYDRRISQLESSNLRLKWAVAIAGGLAVVALLRPLPVVPSQPADGVLRGRKLVIENAEGVPVILGLSSDTGGTLAVTSTAGAVGLSSRGKTLMVYGNRAGQQGPSPTFALRADEHSAELRLPPAAKDPLVAR